MSNHWLITHRERDTGRWITPRVVDHAEAEAHAQRLEGMGLRSLVVDLDTLEKHLGRQ